MGEYQVLNSIEAFQIRPEMYIGSTETPLHLVHEILDNSIDEMSNGFANRIELFFNEDEDSIWISDNGRGLESYEMELEDGSTKDSVEVLFSKTHSGSKFELKESESLIGMNGVGLVAVNALSDWVFVRIRDRKNKTIIYEYYFQDAILKHKKIIANTEDDFSTMIGFKPSEKYFDSISFDKRIFGERLILAQSRYINSKFIINNKVIPKISMEEYVKSKLQLESNEELYKLDYTQSANCKIQVYLTYKNSTINNILGDVNLRSCSGKFLTAFQTELKRIIKTKVNKKFQKLNDKEFLSGLNLYISLIMPEPKFDSQTKIRMVSNIKQLLITPLTDQIIWFVSQKEILTIIENNLNKKFQNSLVKTRGKRSKRVSVANKLRDCIYSPGKTLYIVEGDSAGGTVNILRDKNYEACFPLKGKILNVETHSLEKIKSNKEVQDLIETLGPVNKRRYKNVKILCDADSICAETPIVFINNMDLIECKEIQHISKNEIHSIVSLNKNTGESEIKPVLDVIQHKYQKDYIYRIKCYGNHYIDCTDDHVIYVYNLINDKIEEVSPLDIDTNIHQFICCEKFPTISEDINSVQKDQKSIICVINSQNINIKQQYLIKLFNYNEVNNSCTFITKSIRMKDNIVVLLKQLGNIPIIEHSQYIFIITVDFNKLLNNERQFKSIGKNTISIPIKDVQKIKYEYDVVYDLEVQDNNNFTAGTFGGILHNSDGLHITVLTLLFLQKFASDLIKEGRVSVILPPLYGAIKKKNYIPVYDQKYVSYYKQQGYNIIRFKGLGEMNPNQLKICLDSKMEHYVTYPETQQVLDNIISIVINKDVKRAIMNDNRCHYKHILNYVQAQNELNKN